MPLLQLSPTLWLQTDAIIAVRDEPRMDTLTVILAVPATVMDGESWIGPYELRLVQGQRAGMLAYLDEVASKQYGHLDPCYPPDAQDRVEHEATGGRYDDDVAF